MAKVFFLILFVGWFGFAVQAQNPKQAPYNSYAEINFYWEKKDGSWAHYYNPTCYMLVTDSSAMFYTAIKELQPLENAIANPLTDVFLTRPHNNLFSFEATQQNLGPDFKSQGKATALGKLLMGDFTKDMPLDIVKKSVYIYTINFQGSVNFPDKFWKKEIYAQLTGNYRFEVRNVLPLKRK